MVQTQAMKSWHWNLPRKSQVDRSHLQVVQKFPRRATVDGSNASTKNSFISCIDTLGEAYIVIDVSLGSGLFRIRHSAARGPPSNSWRARNDNIISVSLIRSSDVKAPCDYEVKVSSMKYSFRKKPRSISTKISRRPSATLDPVCTSHLTPHDPSGWAGGRWVS